MHILRNKYLTLFLVAGFLGLVVYFLFGRTLGYEYVWDDTLLFVDKISLLNDPLTWRLLVEPVLPGTSYMRPLVFLTFYVEFAIWGQHPFVSHLINLVILFGNAVLLYLLAGKVFRANNKRQPTILAVLAALIYVIHPALIEASAWVSGRFDLLSTFFILLACYVYLSFRRFVLLRAVIASIAMLLSLFSKELGIVTPAVIFCLWLCMHYSSGSLLTAQVFRFFRENIALVVCIAITTALYFILRTSAMGEVYHTGFDLKSMLHSYFIELNPIIAFAFYLLKVFVPFFDLGPLHPFVSVDKSSPLVWVGIVFSFVLLAGMLWKLYRGGSPFTWVCMAALVCLLPVLHIIPLSIGGNIGHQRFLTAPLALMSIAIFLPNYVALLGQLGVREFVAEKAIKFLFICWGVFAVFLHSGFTDIWSSDYSLWYNAYKNDPDFPAASYNYIYGAIKVNKLDEAMDVLEEYKESHGGFTRAYQSMYADILIRQGDEESLQYMEGLVYSLPKFYKIEDGKEYVDNFVLTAKNLGGIYSTYASALVVFDGNLDKASDQLDIAEWYLRDGEDVMIMYQRSAIEYLKGNGDAAKDILDVLYRLHYSGREHMERLFNTLVMNYCEMDKNTGRVPCEKWSADEWWRELRKM